MARVIWEFQGLDRFGTGVIRVIRVGQDSLRFLVWVLQLVPAIDERVAIPDCRGRFGSHASLNVLLELRSFSGKRGID